jgi:hypothetical protein
MTQVHIVDSLINAGFDKQFVRRHRVFTRAAVIASGPHAEYTMMVAPPLTEEDWWTVNVYKIKPTEIRNELPVEKETEASFRPKHWYIVKNAVTNFLNNN